MPYVPAVDDVLDALMAAAAAAGLKVLDGNDEPSSRSLDRFVVVGGDGDFTGTPRPAGVSDQTPASFGASTDERGVVLLAVVAQSGGDSLSTVRGWSKTDLAALEAQLRASVTLGGVVVEGMTSRAELYQSRSTQGATARRVLTYRYTAFLDTP